MESKRVKGYPYSDCASEDNHYSFRTVRTTVVAKGPVQIGDASTCFSAQNAKDCSTG